MSHILLVASDPASLEAVVASLRDAEHDVSVARTLAEARQRLLSAVFDAVVASHELPDGSGSGVLNTAAVIDNCLTGVLVNGQLQAPTKRDWRFEIADLRRPEAVRDAVWRASEVTRLCRENLLATAAYHHLGRSNSLQGDSAAVRALRGRIVQAAASRFPVMIVGESGAGKQLAARAIHVNSASASSPFVRIAGSTFIRLLQHGVDPPDSALLRAIGNGTLFVETIDAYPADAESSLLRFLQTGAISRRASQDSLGVHARIMLATTADREKAGGASRSSGLETAEMMSVHVPPLRERMEDIAALCDHFSQQTASDLGLPVRPLSSAAIAKLRDYRFPGNVRELRNMVERAYTLSATQELQPEDFLVPASDHQGSRLSLPPAGSGSAAGFDLLAYLQRVEEELIRRTLDASGGAQAEAARRMGISRSLLAYKLNKYGIRPSETMRGQIHD